MAGASASRVELSARTTRRTGPVPLGPASPVPRLVAVLAAFGLLGAACAEEPRPAGPPVAATLTEADNGTTVRLAEGEIVEVRLGSNATTGYAWHLIEDDLETDVVQVASSDYVPDETPADQPIAGSGGTEVWRFRGAMPGEATVGMAYYFGDESAERAAEFTFTVIVE